MEYSIYKANVVKGQGLASKELLPTLNLDTRCLPEDFKYGVYSCYVFLYGNRFPAMMHYGPRSTDSNISLELHVIDLVLDVDFLDITFQPCTFIRDVMKFDSLQDLKKQLGFDLINIVNNV
jgi:riboflavin kinase / FMN adenylyltransferase